MKPLGTIAKDFPFIDDVTRKELDSAMRNATDYWNFTNILTERIIQIKSPLPLVFFSIYHSRNLENNQAIAKLKPTYQNVALVKPLFLSDETTYENLVDSVERAIGSDSNPAVLFYLLCNLYASTDPGSIEERNVQQQVEELLDRNDLLLAHRAYYYINLGFKHRYEGNPPKAFELYEQALEISKKADDRWYESCILRFMAEISAQYTSGSDSYARARDFLTRAKKISELLNDRANIAMIFQNIAVTSSSRGELTESIHSQLEAIRIFEALGADIGADAYNLSSMYSSVGEGENALEWAKYALEHWGVDPHRSAYSHIAMAHAYVVLNQRDNARKFLDSAKEQILKSGLELAFGKWYHILGQLERSQGDLDSAMDSFQRALEINERAKRHVRGRACLLSLAATEMELFSPTKENIKDDNSGPWMSRMMETVAETDLPGYNAELMLLQTELRMRQGRTSEAEKLMEQLLRFSEHPGVKHIHKKAQGVREQWILEGVLLPESTERRNRF